MSETITCTDAHRELYSMAQAAADHAYAPYSRFHVGAAIRSTDGTVFTGCNVENASYGLAICAERVACTSAIAAGHRLFDAVAVHVDAPDGQPCGSCRQFLSEFSGDMQVVYRRAGEIVVVRLGELLPDSFHSAALPTR